MLITKGKRKPLKDDEVVTWSNVILLLPPNATMPDYEALFARARSLGVPDDAEMINLGGPLNKGTEFKFWWHPK